jgi:salicylate hydroxylase
VDRVTIKSNRFTFRDGKFASGLLSSGEHSFGFFLAGKTGEDLGLLVLHDKLMKALAADFLYIQVRCHFLT